MKANPEKMDQRAVNWGPLSVEMFAGTPNLATQLNKKALAHVLTVASSMGIASGQRVNLSTMVKR